jgi:hypothetical protein
MTKEMEKTALSARFEKLLRKEELEPIKKGLVKIFDQKYRMNLFYEQEAPEVNIIITWLLIFMASLEYQLDPFKNGFKGVNKSQ